MKIVYPLLMTMVLLAGSLLAQTYSYNVQLQMADVKGVPIENTGFWVTLNVTKNGDQITVFLPPLNFQVGPCASTDPDCSAPVKGFLVTASGFLPPDWRPNTLIPVSVIASSANGFTQSGTPPAGYIVLIDNAGTLLIQQAGASGNQLAIGSHSVLPCALSYTASKAEQICFNFQISEGEIDVNSFQGSTAYTAAGDNIRDSHTNDAFDNTLAWAWTDNHNVPYTAQTLNLFVSIGQIDKKGRLKMGKPIQVTNFPANMIAWDTSIAINRQNKNNIVVSYGVLSFNSDGTHSTVSKTARAVSFDGGKTWGGVFDGVNSLPQNGFLTYQTGTVGDVPGVQSDQFGNFWYGVTDASTDATIPYLLLSTDGGVNWSLTYSFPDPPPGGSYDYPHLAFGSNGAGQYGIWYYVDYYNVTGDIIYPAVAFIPVTGLGAYGSGTVQYLTAFPNSIQTPSIIVANDGRFWALGKSATSSFNFSFPVVSLFKSPGALGENYAGPWIVGSQNNLSEISNNIFRFDSVPFFGYFLSVQGVLYDEARQALYALFAANSPALSQNMQLYFTISRNNGLTWSPPYEVSTTAFANRGFVSMALDKGNLYIGWYDGRNDPALQKIQYFGGIIPSQKLNSLVNKVPVSYPVFTISGQGTSTPPS